MKNASKIAQPQPATRKKPMLQGVMRGISDVVRGNFLVRNYILANLPFILFLAFLMIAYIAYGYFAEHNVKELYRAQQELKDLKAQHLTSRAELEKIKQQSSVAQRIQALGLIENTDPPRLIVADDEQQ